MNELIEAKPIGDFNVDPFGKGKQRFSDLGKAVKQYSDSINQARQGFVAAGYWLKKMSDESLYRGYPKNEMESYWIFNDFVEGILGVSHSSAYRMIEIYQLFGTLIDGEPRLRPEYEAFSMSQLTEIGGLISIYGSKIVELVDSSFTVKEIRRLKEAAKTVSLGVVGGDSQLFLTEVKREFDRWKNQSKKLKADTVPTTTELDRICEEVAFEDVVTSESESEAVAEDENEATEDEPEAVLEVTERELDCVCEQFAFEDAIAGKCEVIEDESEDDDGDESELEAESERGAFKKWKLNNKAAREAFLADYRNWRCLGCFEPLGLTFYEIQVGEMRLIAGETLRFNFLGNLEPCVRYFPLGITIGGYQHKSFSLFGLVTECQLVDWLTKYGPREVTL